MKKIHILSLSQKKRYLDVPFLVKLPFRTNCLARIYTDVDNKIYFFNQ